VLPRRDLISKLTIPRLPDTRLLAHWGGRSVKRPHPVLVVGLLFVPVGVAATPILSIDLDPATPGTQSSRSVAVGESFEVDVLLTGDGSTLFDTLGIDMPFNDTGIVLGFSAPALAGAMADNALLAFDVLAFSSITSGASLATAAEPPSAGFASGIGGVVYASLGGPFDLVSVGAEFSLIRASFLGLAVGQSTIGIVPIFGGPLLAFEGNPVAVDLAFGEVTVTATGPTPALEPSTLFLLVVGIAGLASGRRHDERRRVSRRHPFS